MTTDGSVVAPDGDLMAARQEALVDLARLEAFLRDASALVARVALEGEEDDIVVLVQLDPLLVKSRAIQQGLADMSVAAAAADPRVQRPIAEAVERARIGCGWAYRSVRYEIADEPARRA